MDGVGRALLATALFAVTLAASGLAQAASSSATATASGQILYTDPGPGSGNFKDLSIEFRLTADDKTNEVRWTAFAGKAPYDVAITKVSLYSPTLTLYEGPEVSGDYSANTQVAERDRSVLKSLVADPSSFSVRIEGTYNRRLPNGTFARTGFTIDGKLSKTGGGGGGGGSGGSAAIEPEDVKALAKRMKASKRFGELRAKLDPTGNEKLTQTLIGLTDRQIETVEGLDLVCWLGGGSAGAVLTAAGRLRGAIRREIVGWFENESFVLTGGLRGLAPCEMLVLATVLTHVALNQAGSALASSSTGAAKRRRCVTGAVGLSVDSSGAVSLSSTTPKPALKVSCGFKGKGQKQSLTVTARTRNKRTSLKKAVGPKIGLAVASTKKPTKKPKVKVKITQGRR